ncbi:hypothetical protein PHISP_05463 [Aspergillus sp. HF37]|nr:hypothetical protein PHISP_05463 [Aspergillus sp. HF37]
MTSDIPATLKSADIGRFAVRAAQLEQPKPVVAYWCNFWIVNQIIEKGLHTADEEVKLYTTDLVDKLEQFKSQHPDNETVTDSVAANAYVEQFGMEVFNRAETTMNASKVTKQTADTFQAAATFLELCQIWNNPPEHEVAAKIKFAKYHALRIAKAIRAGEDPNASNPAPREAGEDIETEFGQVDADARDIEGQAESSGVVGAGDRTGKQRQPSVEEIPDDWDRVQRMMAPQSSLDESLHPSRSSSIPPHASTAPAAAPAPAVSSPAPAGQPMDVDAEQEPGLTLPSAPETIAPPPSVPNLPSTPGTTNLRAPSHPSQPPDSFKSFPPPARSLDPASFYNPPTAPAEPAPAPAPAVPNQAPQPMRAPAPQATSRANAPAVDDQSIGLAQKHARWAVSALTFDDVGTAVNELRNSLRYLGAE